MPYAWIYCHKSFRALASRGNLARLVRDGVHQGGVCPQLSDIPCIGYYLQQNRNCKAVHSDAVPKSHGLATNLGFVNRPIKRGRGSDRGGLCARQVRLEKSLAAQSRLPRHCSDTFARRQLKHLPNSYRFFPYRSPSSRRGSV